MRTVKLTDLGDELIELINNPDPVEEDIGVVDNDGNLRGVFISKDAYEFFLEKVEEEEDRLDSETVRDFKNSGEQHQ